MPAEITFPIKTIFYQNGTFTSDQLHFNVDASDVRSLMCGVNVASLTGSTGVGLSVGGQGPDGAYYQLGEIPNFNGAGTITIQRPIPAVLNVSLGLGGASSATLAWWVIGQA